MKIGIFGLGSIGMRHAKNAKMLGHEVYGFDPVMERRLALNGVLYEPHEIFEIADAIVIATPTDKHLPVLRDAIAAKKPVMVEKPIADEISPLLLDLVDTDLPNMVGYNLRFHGAVLKVKQWLDEGKIGQPYWGHFCCAQRNERYGDSVVLNWSHEIDLALYLLGPATMDAATLRRHGRIDIADLNLEHQSGAQSTIHLDYVTKPFQRHGKIAGSKGVISFNLEDIRFAHLNGGDLVYCPDSWDENYLTEMKAFIDRCNGKATPGATLKDGLATLQICHDALTWYGP